MISQASQTRPRDQSRIGNIGNTSLLCGHEWDKSVNDQVAVSLPLKVVKPLLKIQEAYSGSFQWLDTSGCYHLDYSNY
jgi:hypothetical protein